MIVFYYSLHRSIGKKHQPGIGMGLLISENRLLKLTSGSKELIFKLPA